MSPGASLQKLSGYPQLGGDPGADPEVMGGLYISHLAFEHCGISQVELEKAEEKDIQNTKLGLLWLGDAERMKGGILNFKWQLWASL